MNKAVPITELINTNIRLIPAILQVIDAHGYCYFGPVNRILQKHAVITKFRSGEIWGKYQIFIFI